MPEIYRRSWQGESDALIALIRNALRLDRDEAAREETVDEEILDLGDLEREPEPMAPRPSVPRVQQRVLTRYRNAVVKLLERGEMNVAYTPLWG